MKFLSVGNITCDVYARPSSIQKNPARLLLDDVKIFPGGDATNNAIDYGILGEDAALIGCIGRDEFGEILLNKLRKTNVSLKWLRIDPEVPTTFSYLMINEDGTKRTPKEGGWGYRKGGNEALREKDIPDEALEWADHLHIGSALRMDGMDGGENAILLKRAKEHGVTTSMDLMIDLDDVWMPKIREALWYCDIFIPSDYEVEKVCGLQDPLEMKEFFRPYGMSVFGVKMGEKGVYVTNFEKDIFMPSMLKGNPVDTIGAGDAFFSAFVIAYKRGYRLEECVQIASCSSVYAMSKVGANAGMVSFETLLESVDIKATINV